MIFEADSNAVTNSVINMDFSGLENYHQTITSCLTKTVKVDRRMPDSCHVSTHEGLLPQRAEH